MAYQFARVLQSSGGFRALCIAVAAALPAASLAQDVVLEEITVTAQKREQSTLDVPLTVDVFSADDMEKTGALNISEMQDFIPGFEMGSNPTQASISIRGISSVGISSGGDPSVATFYDDIYVPRAATTIAFTDVARVEVLKGPQGTLYGRNAAAGVVSIVPNRPGADNEAFTKLRIGNYGLARIEVMGNIAVSDNFFLRANVLSNQRDGYLTNLVPGQKDPGEQDNLAARISGLWRISEATDLQLSYDYDRVDNSARGAVGLSQWGACPTDPRCDVVLNDVIDGEETRDMWAANLKLFHEINDDWSAKFVTGFRTFDVVNKQDEDGTAEYDRYLDTDNIEDSDIAYTELQFNFSNERINLVFGGNLSKEDTSQVIPVNSNTDSVMRAVTAGLAQEFGVPLDHLWNPDEMAGALTYLNSLGLFPFPVTPQDVMATGDLFYEALAADPLLAGVPFFGPSFAGQPWSEIYYNNGDFTNWGIYGDVDFQVNDRWNLLFGLRYSNDEKTFSWRNPPNTFTAMRPGTPDLIFQPDPLYPDARNGTLTATDDWDKLTGRAVARYQLADNAQAFLSYSTGYKSGGYDSLDVWTSDHPLRPEESENIELGVKGDFADDRLRLQLSLFAMDIDGRQRTVDSRPPGQNNPIPTVNSGDQSVEGIEVTLNWLITDNVQFNFLTTWRDAQATWDPYFDANGDPAGGPQASNATDLDYTLWLGWQPEIGPGNLDVRLEYIYNENTSYLDDSSVVDPALFPGFYEDREELNVRIGWVSEDDKWTAALWGKNLLDQKLLGGISDISILFGTPFTSIGAPLTYGAEVGYRF
ncbi:MAG: TonB-dependent receptor [Gammaproteobacteria bacterium]|nr:TonB-dependent receptor [Gammaproteobacteria bacterium]